VGAWKESTWTHRGVKAIAFRQQQSAAALTAAKLRAGTVHNGTARHYGKPDIVTYTFSRNMDKLYSKIRTNKQNHE